MLKKLCLSNPFKTKQAFVYMSRNITVVFVICRVQYYTWVKMSTYSTVSGTEIQHILMHLRIHVQCILTTPCTCINQYIEVYIPVTMETRHHEKCHLSMQFVKGFIIADRATTVWCKKCAVVKLESKKRQYNGHNGDNHIQIVCLLLVL